MRDAGDLRLALDADSLLAAEARLRYDRRLSDKLLHAYAQAYAQGEARLAERLRALLDEAEAAGREGYPNRRKSDARRQADLWTAFCDARELYRHAHAGVRLEAAGQTAALSPVAETRLDATLELMRIAYLRWQRAM